jgi:murein DD-endopeptidase MepM/ murein hydrolase activator NlpD
MFLLSLVSIPVTLATGAPMPAAAPAVTRQQQPVPPASLEARLAHLQQRVPVVAFYIHTVKLKENLWKIAAKRGYSVHTLIGCNPELKNYEVSAGQRILIPSKAGTLHQVLSDDTWERIAARYRVPVEQLRNINSGVTAPATGEFIFVPGRRPVMELMNEGMRKQYELHALFVSPLGGRLSSFFGRRKHPVTGQKKLHAGIDIAVREGTWVGAAADGVVTVAASGIGHYGTAVFIDHGNGYETQYGHLSQVFVRPGQRVKARQLIAKSGSTGWSTGPHLHFTIKKDGVPKDPLKYLW